MSEHSGAERVAVRGELADGPASLEIADDGRGFSADEAEARRVEGHLGLRLLHDLARDAGGSVEVDSAPGAGTRVRIEVDAR